MNLKTFKLGMLTLAVAACAANSSPQPSSVLESFAPVPSNFRLSLTDAPSKDLSAVFVNVKQAELWLENGGGKEARLIVAENLGFVDLMTLRNGVLLPMQDLTIPVGISVKKIRLVLGDGNYAIKINGDVCPMRTPSAQQSGIKIHLSQNVSIEENNSYSLVMDFDAEKSVVVTGTGECLLKPVLRVAGFTKTPVIPPTDEGTTPEPGTGTDTGSGGDNGSDTTGGSDGFDITDPSTWPPGYTPIDIEDGFYNQNGPL